MVVDTRTVKLNPGQSTTVSFSYTPEKEGIYSIDVNGLTGSLTVSREETPGVVSETIWLAIGIVAIVAVILATLFFRKPRRQYPYRMLNLKYRRLYKKLG
ncbi:MAG: hypothetical protein QW566_05480 [Candidatus Jordarchaeales archaeon]